MAQPPRSRHLGLSAYWFGLYCLFTPVGGSLAPAQINDIVSPGRQLVAQGVLLAAGSVVATLVPPFVGAWSDRLSTRFGRRRPIIVGGTAGTVVGLLIMLTAATYPHLVVGYVIVQLFSNAAAGAYAGMIPDIVPAGEVGDASGLLAMMVLVGSAVGLVGNVALGAIGARNSTYLLLAVVLVATMIPTLRASRGEGMAAGPAPTVRRQGSLARLRAALRPLREGDFAWVVATRLLITAGISAVSPFLFFFFRDVVGVGNPDLFTPIWLLVVLVVAAPTALLGGRRSDRIGRRRYVVGSGWLQAATVGVFLALYPTSIPLVLLMGGVYGAGYGLYQAVDWALAVDTLPDRASAAKDMGLFHVALALPGNIVPAVVGVMLDSVNRTSHNAGYRVVFGVAALCFVLGTVLIRKIRSIR